jgi:hypothetical protein
MKKREQHIGTWRLPHLAFPSRLASPLAITHVAVVPLDTERVLPDQTVIIEHGRIQVLAPSNEVDISSLPAVLDGAGKYLMPGLADMHVHYWSPGDAPLFLAQGVTLVRNMSGAPFHLALQQQVERGEMPGPRIITTSPIVEGDSFLLPLWYRATHPADAERIVQECVQRGYEQIKVYNALTSDTLQALGQAAATCNVRMTGHCPTAMTFEEAIAAGMSCFEHLVGIWREHLKEGFEQRPDQNNLDLDVVLMTAHNLDFEALRRLASQMAVKQVWNCPTLVALRWMHEAYTTGVADPSLRPWLKYVSHPAMQLWKELDPSQHRPQYEQWLKAWHARNDTLLQVVSLLHEEGAPLLIGTDTSVRFVIQGLSVHQELANFVRAGLRPFEALSCATREAARFLDQSGEWGTVTAGKRADLLLVRANPLEDVAALHDLEAVFVNGFYLPRAELDALLDQQEQLALPQHFEALSAIQLHTVDGQEAQGERAEWLEYVNDTLCGRLSYRHQVLPTEEWYIDERYVFEQGSIFYLGGSQYHTTSAWLNPDLTLRQATYVYESFAGTEQGEITWTPEEGYVIHRTEIDGYEVHTTLKTPPTLPGDMLVHTVWPLYLKGKQDSVAASTVPLLSMDGSVIRIEEMTLTAPGLDAPAKEDTSQQWHLHLQQAQGSREYIYQFDQKGVFLSVREGQRKLVAYKDTDLVSSKNSMSK